eukprot:6756188-Prymnesium_polylepis.1
MLPKPTQPCIANKPARKLLMKHADGIRVYRAPTNVRDSALQCWCRTRHLHRQSSMAGRMRARCRTSRSARKPE